MGFELKGIHGQTFEFTGTGWTFFLNLAEQYGWIPHKTQKPKGYGFFKKWSGAYDTNEGQTVSSQDASNLADSLERSLSDPQLSQRAINLAQNLQTAIEKAVGHKLGYTISGDIDLNYVKNFIQFCRSGGFEIK